MRLLIVSDIQLGAGAGYGTPQTPRLADQARTLEIISTLVPEANIDGVIFCGDAFQHRRPDVDELLIFDEWLESLPVEVLMLAGNHDIRGPGRRSVLELFDVGDHYTDVCAFLRPAVRVMNDPAGGASIVAGFLPWAHPGTIRAHGNPDPEEQAEALLKIAEGLRGQAEELTRSSGYIGNGPEPMPVLFTHYALTGMSIPSGLSTSELREPVLDSQELAAQGWRYIFAGHVHKPEAIRGAGLGTTLVSIGSPHVCDFGEDDVEHGVWILDTATDSAEYVPIEGRPFVTLEWTGIEGYDEWRGSPVFDARVVGGVVRLLWHLTPDEAARVDADAVKLELYAHGAFKVWEVRLDIERRTRARAEVLEDTAPHEALEAWLGAQAEPIAEADALRELTTRLLQEGER